ncbi:SRPBCC family protein [Beggiatoa leptomitoformis]|uniref:SRPBCC family protein n=1 Tax=Beggiatoa leptomitoformis TaxID=288004 RepID=A0A2N9YHE2_9GAMM|nr:SRPBCC family protein [Beggiatoa leptomitoformis]ALG68074.1 SRPBCC family protein [Beggiatoa leptomitoformis]AUI69636.1 SRPBCC family protein [Beggiatoa leptomitoformis]
MKKWLALLGVAVLGVNSTISFAAETVGMLTVKSEMMVRGTPEKVWAVIGGFNDLPKWHPAVANSKLDISGDATAGGITSRVLTLNAPNAPVLIEQLISQDPVAMTYSYTLTKTEPAILPVKNYTATLSVSAAEKDKSLVTWEGSFLPLPTATAEDAKKAVEGVYSAGLVNLKEMLNTTSDGKVLPERETGRGVK